MLKLFKQCHLFQNPPVSVPTSYIQIQNELTPARSPGSCKVRFSEKSNESNESSESIDKNRSGPIENLSFNEESKCIPQHQPSTTTAYTTKSKLSGNLSITNGIISGKFYSVHPVSYNKNYVVWIMRKET